jgi:serine/threonine-protein kinase
MWQQSGSPDFMTFSDAEDYVRDANEKRFAGHDDWRLPTLEEAMSLMAPKQNHELCIAPLFDRTQRWIWTIDKSGAEAAWVVAFDGGYCTLDLIHDASFVRAVREIGFI